MWFWFLLFMMGFVLDVLYIAWMWSAERRCAWLAGWSSVAIYGMSVFGTIEVLENRGNCLPLFAGVFVGSYLGVKFTKRLDAKRESAKIQA